MSDGRAAASGAEGGAVPFSERTLTPALSQGEREMFGDVQTPSPAGRGCPTGRVRVPVVAIAKKEVALAPEARAIDLFSGIGEKRAGMVASRCDERERATPC
jgi:hypothetical protein